MLTGHSIAVIGGDARQLELIRKLSEWDANLFLIGFDQLDHGFTGASKVEIEDVNMEEMDSILLPVSGTSSQGKVETIFSNKEIILTAEHLKRTPEHCTVYSGISNDYLEQCVNEANRELVKLFERNDVAIYNSIPTAEGTVMMVIQNTDVTIHDSDVMVLGFGRTGMTVARTMAALGARVKVGARRSEHLARISEMGIEPFYIENLEREVNEIDICINTVPAPVLNAKVLSHMPLSTLIIDLASKPGGTDFRYADKRGIKALLAPGLPGIVAPKTAGQILAKVLQPLLIENQKKGEQHHEA
ncbi:MAG TPA: dipicolinic acid synthetase subunit A [Bacillales bacterium]|nr:dipicolinic acid synthetase subunit A [Bacillales bacterium]